MNNLIKKIAGFSLLTVCSFLTYAQQDTVSLSECYVLAKENYPLIKQYKLIAESSEYSLKNIEKGYLPRISINGQASYQSDITQLPKGIPGIPVLTKEQYKIYAEADQPIYDGGLVRSQKELEEANANVQEKSLEVELYKIKDRINQLYFGILFIDEQLKQNDLLKKDLQLGLDKINALIENGTALKSNGDVLKAELLKAGQQSVELIYNRKSLSSMLGLFIKKTLDENTYFIKPANLVASAEIKRPELLMFDYRKKIFDAQDHLITAKNNPKLNFFVQGGLGKPAFNILSNNPDLFYIGGIRVSFPLSGFYTTKNERSILRIGKQNIDAERETFLFNTQLALSQQSADVNKLNQFLKSDDAIISLRTSVKKTSLAQLENGVITSADYLREVHAEDSAKQNKILHEIQLLIAQYTQQNITGN